jgi:methyltransferase (TIGR00027 family)
MLASKLAHINIVYHDKSAYFIPREITNLSNNVKPVDKLRLTARWTAAVRAYETARADQLFNDPWATLLAGQEGREWLESRSVEGLAPIILRTRYFDDYLQYITRETQVRQIILMAAGLDTRAFRLKWPEQTKIFELDLASVLEEKETILSVVDACPTCLRRIVKVDLTGAWSDALMTASFEPGRPSGWLLEGFLFYLPNETITDLLSRISQLATSGSCLGFDIVNSTTLTHPLVRAWIEMQANAGAPWIGTIDDPIGFLKALGWKATLTQAGQPDANYGRWPFPVIPTLMPDIPHNWYVTAEKE